MKRIKRDFKALIVSACFMLTILGFMLVNIIVPDKELSYSERRRLFAAPVFSVDRLFSGKLTDDFEKYTMDQFVLRDAFRGLKAAARYFIFNQKDNNGIYIIDGNISKLEYPLNERSVRNASLKLNDICSRYLEGMNVYYAVIPDKNYFLASKNGYLAIDYDQMIEILEEEINSLNYIDITDTLTIDDYYKTDIHWSQDRIVGTADKLLKGMGNDARASEFDYNMEKLHPFYGSYYGQAALRLKPDSLVYLTNSILEDAVVYDYETGSYGRVYEPERFSGVDPYDVFLSGARALMTVSNPASTSDKELILFRDSFGSSIAPLLLAGYSRVTLIDLRYISTGLLGDYIDFSKDADVLFLYNTLVLNNSYMLK